MIAGRFTIPYDHPSLPGHFPGHPLVPGVILLHHVLACLGGATLLTVKFTAPVLPGIELEVREHPGPNGTVQFNCHGAGRSVLHGTARPR